MKPVALRALLVLGAGCGRIPVAQQTPAVSAAPADSAARSYPPSPSDSPTPTPTPLSVPAPAAPPPPPLPVISQLTPNHMPADINSLDGVWIDGAHLTGATAVRFGAYPPQFFSVVSDSRISANAYYKQGAPSGWVDVTVTTPAGTSVLSSGDRFYFAAGAVITSISPNTVPHGGGTTVVILGRNLAFAEVRITCQPAPPCPGGPGTLGGSLPVQFTNVSDNEITFVSPALDAPATGNVDAGNVGVPTEVTAASAITFS